MLDGVGVLFVVLEKVFKEFNLMLFVCFVSFVVCGVLLEIMGIGLKEVILVVLKVVGLK